MRVACGILSGSILSATCGFLLMYEGLLTDIVVAIIVAAIMGVVGAVYSAVAFHKSIYGHGFFSILGYLLDMTWSWLNTLAGLLVWIPACLILGANLVTPNSDSRRSGTFVYDKNPRGGGFETTTIGTVIAGKWSSHEEVHVWQARIFGPVYLIVYGLAFVLNALFRLITLRVSGLLEEAYHGICCEDWAYWGGSVSGRGIHWRAWVGGFFLTLLYLTFMAMIPLGIYLKEEVIWIMGIAELALYSLIRALAPRWH